MANQQIPHLVSKFAGHRKLWSQVVSKGILVTTQHQPILGNKPFFTLLLNAMNYDSLKTSDHLKKRVKINNQQ